MASSNLLISSSPTAAHQLHHSFRHFEPHPSPLSTATIYRQHHFNRYSNQDELDDDYFDSSLIGSEGIIEVEHLEAQHEEEQNGESEVEQDKQTDDYQSSGDSSDDGDLDTEHDYHHQEHNDHSGQTSFVDYEEDYQDDDGETEELVDQVLIDTFSPSLDASFASSMSIGTAPPSPSINPQRTAFINNVRFKSFAGPNSSLPAHLFAPNPNAMPPSSSPHRMDISPASATSRLNIPSYSHRPSIFQPHSPDDPFGGAPSRENGRALRKPSSRPKLTPDAIFLHSSRVQPDKSSPRSLAPPSDGMDIDSPGYAQPRHCDHFGTLGSSVNSNDQSAGSLQFPERTSRSTSESSTGKRSRSDEDDERERVLRPSSSGSHCRQSLTSEPLASVSSESPAAVPRQILSSIFCDSVHASAHDSHSFSPQHSSSSPNQMISPSVKAAAKMTLGRKAGERSLSGFRFPLTKSNVATAHISSSTRHQHYGMGSLGSASGSGTAPRRPTLGVVQSSATLFGYYQSSSVTNAGMNRQRDASGRPASKSRRAISFAATEGDTLNLLLQGSNMATDPDDDDEESELDVSSVFNCSPAPRTSHTSFQHPLVSNTWPKLSESPIRPNRCVNSTRNKFKLTHKVTSVPMGSSSLAPPKAHPGTIFQSPTRALVVTLGSTIESPAGMAFSEKERAGKILPCHKVSNDGLMRISPETMDSLLDGVYDDSISSKIIVDCRFSYEYEGGHIRAAINIHDKEVVDAMLLQGELFEGGRKDVPLPSESGKHDFVGEKKKVVVVFHCEYSAMRAPTLAKYLREKDRHMNMPHYPALHYPEVYILEGGYARYHAHSPHHCDGVYVRMDDPSYRNDRHADLNQFRTRESAVFSRAKSFTYGESKKMMKNANLTKKPSFTLGHGRSESQIPINTFFSGIDSKENISQYNKIVEEEEEDAGIPESDS